MTRHIKEVIRVRSRPGNINIKGEFGGGSIPRIVGSVMTKTECESVESYSSPEAEGYTMTKTGIQGPFPSMLAITYVKGNQLTARSQVINSVEVSENESKERQNNIPPMPMGARTCENRTPHQKKVTVKEGRKCKSSERMSVLEISVMFKNMHKKISQTQNRLKH